MLFDEDVLVHRDAVHRHCQRMLGCPLDAEDALQETLLRAWRFRRTAASNPRAWLYRIATNVCVDALQRRVPTVPVDDFSPTAPSPDAEVIDRETIELALRTASSALPPLQHASWVMRDVLQWSARDTACALSTSVPAANSALQRARSGLRSSLARDRLEWVRA
jgi:RNA polymerase sigma factor (sigma-70 family)